jgi:hypothetical protein
MNIRTLFQRQSSHDSVGRNILYKSDAKAINRGLWKGVLEFLTLATGIKLPNFSLV